jgi:hypothetical protein
MRATRVAVSTTVLCCGLLTGCGTHAGAPGRSAMPSSDDHHGALDGRVLRPPGRDPRSGASARTPVPVTGDPIRARDPAGKVVASTVTAAGGAFHLRLPPGRYRITEDICGIGREVDITARTTTTVTLTVPNAC